MSQSQAHTVGRQVLDREAKRLDEQIDRYERDLVNLKSEAINLAGDIDYLRRQRSSIQDAIRLHFSDGDE